MPKRGDVLWRGALAKHIPIEPHAPLPHWFRPDLGYGLRIIMWMGRGTKDVEGGQDDWEQRDLHGKNGPGPDDWFREMMKIP